MRINPEQVKDWNRANRRALNVYHDEQGREERGLCINPRCRRKRETDTPWRTECGRCRHDRNERERTQGRSVA